MKSIKLTTLIIVVLTLSLFDVKAQPKPDPQKIAATETSWMKENLALTPEQETKVSVLSLKYANKVSAVIEGVSGFPSSETRSKLKALESQKEVELKPLLTNLQWNRYEKDKNKLKRKVRSSMRNS